MKRRGIALLLTGCIALGLTACGSKEGAVYVQSVTSLSQMGGIAPGDKFAGLVVSENVTEIKRDSDKMVDELFIREGDDVKEGQELFSYDTDQLQLTLDKQRLEKEQLESTIESLGEQIAQLEKDSKYAGTRDKLEYTIQIQTNQVELKEAQLNLKNKEAEVAKSEELMEHSTVLSPVDGRVTSISESGTDNNGNPLPYITIQQTGAYRVKGMLNELQRGGIVEGDRLRMESRVDPSQVWMGTVTVVDYENPTQGSSNNYIYTDSDEMSSSSRYPFYVELDSIDGLLLGQHLYLSLDAGEEQSAGLSIGSSFIAYDDDGNPYVWADNGHDKLEKREIQLGEYDMMRDTYEVLGGLDDTDYIAFPDMEVCKSGVPTTRTQPEGVE